MRALQLVHPASGSGGIPLEVVDAPDPEPAHDELLVSVTVCGVCRTDLDLAEGRVVPPRYPIIPGHQVIGRVLGSGGDDPWTEEGTRVGIAWIHLACGKCRWCLSGTENLCP